MGTLFSALNIARSGLAVSQAQLDVVGHNIANVNKPGFSRQRVELVASPALPRPYGQIGTGVEISSVARIRDVFLDQLYQSQMGGLGNAEIRAEFYEQIEDIFLEPGPNGLSAKLNIFFDTLNEFSGNVESAPARTSVITESLALATSLNDIANRLYDLRTDANNTIINTVPLINSLTERIASFNESISVIEVDGTHANDLRDERGVLVDELSKLVNIFTRERANGQVDILVGGEMLVDGTRAELLEAVVNPALDPERNDLVELRFIRTGRSFSPNGAGELFGALEMRDVTIIDLDTEIDTMAASIIEQINAVHTQGMGLVNYTGSRTASNAVSDPTLALGSAGLPFNFTTPGTFDINIYDESTSPATALPGSPVTISITATTTMNDLVAQLGAAPNITANVDANGFLSITAAPGFSFANSNDSSNVLSALGVNALFTGHDARTMGVNQDIVDNVELLSSRFSTNPADIGDNTAALAMANVQNLNVLNNGTNTINGFYESTIVQIGIETRANLDLLSVEESFVASFERRRQEISGVSIDEEVTLLIQFQRSFEASARVVTVTDRMLDSLFNMAR